MHIRAKVGVMEMTSLRTAMQCYYLGPLTYSSRLLDTCPTLPHCQHSGHSTSHIKYDPPKSGVFIFPYMKETLFSSLLKLTDTPLGHPTLFLPKDPIFWMEPLTYYQYRVEEPRIPEISKSHKHLQHISSPPSNFSSLIYEHFEG